MLTEAAKKRELMIKFDETEQLKWLQSFLEGSQRFIENVVALHTLNVQYIELIKFYFFYSSLSSSPPVIVLHPAITKTRLHKSLELPLIFFIVCVWWARLLLTNWIFSDLFFLYVLLKDLTNSSPDFLQVFLSFALDICCFITYFQFSPWIWQTVNNDIWII